MSTLGGEKSNEPLPESWGRPAQPRVGRVGGPPTSGAPRSGGPGRMVTLSDLNNSGGSSGGPPMGMGGRPGRSPLDDDDDDDEDENERQPQSWFAGGERSGLSIQNPESSNLPGGNVVRDLIRRAAEGSRQEAENSIPSRGSSSVFSGGGHTLGSDEVESTYIPDPNAPEDEEEVETAVRLLTLWRDGYTVEDSELMRYGIPENEQILEEIYAGRAPPAILNVLPGQPVELRLARRLDEDYRPGEGTRNSSSSTFGGSGHRLGAPIPTFTESTSSSETMPGALNTSTSMASNDDRPRETLTTRFEVDQSQPMTSVQIRLADGTRMVCRMNLTHTVMDIRNFINAARPENLITPYTIGTTFPNKTLDDDTVTIKDAGLANSVIVQRMV